MNYFPFVILEPYQLIEGDVAFGVFSDEMQHYVMGDGDCYTASELQLIWPGAVLLTWGQLEARLKSVRSRPQNTKGWWCDNCECVVPDEMVVWENHHDPRSGGCGHPLR